MKASTSLRIGLAAARNAPSVEERLQTVGRFLDDAGAQEVAIVCFPETYLGTLLRGFPREMRTPALASREFFLRKAIGWALRQYAWTDPREVRRYVREHEWELSLLSKREALKHA